MQNNFENTLLKVSNDNQINIFPREHLIIFENGNRILEVSCQLTGMSRLFSNL